MKTLKVKPENLEVGKRYFFESKGRGFWGCGTIQSIDNDRENGSTVWFRNNSTDTTITPVKFLERYIFYSAPDDFELKWNQKQLGDNNNVYAYMTVRDFYCPASINLNSGLGSNSINKSYFYDIPDEPETITISGKTYNLNEVTNRIKELKPMENK